MTVGTQEILKFIFDSIGKDPPDSKLVECAAACAAANIALLSTIVDERTRQLAVVDQDTKTQECVEMLAEAMDAVEEGELIVKPRTN